MALTEPAAHLAMKRLYQQLGPGPWEIRNEHDLTGDPLLREIIEVTRIYAGDYPGAALRRQGLIALGALKGVRHEDGSLTFTKSAFPEQVEDTLSWVDKENARIQRVVAENEAMLDRDYEQRKQHQEFLDAPEQANFVHRLHKAGVTPEQIREIVRAEVEAALAQRLTASV